MYTINKQLAMDAWGKEMYKSECLWNYLHFISKYPPKTIVKWLILLKILTAQIKFKQANVKFL